MVNELAGIGSFGWDIGGTEQVALQRVRALKKE
jgi:hypothetical protein